MAMYTYTRNLLTTGDHKGTWDINNGNRVDGGLNKIHLVDEIKTAIPGKAIVSPEVDCNGSNCYIHFAEALTTEEETTLTTVVNNHKNNA
jgi:hypothetical protein